MLIPRPTTALPELPDLAAHRLLTPGILDLSRQTEEFRRAQRRRRIIGFTVAALLHVAALLAFFLSPSLRLKSNPAPERWMPVLSIPAPQPAAPTPQAPAATGSAAPAPHRVPAATHVADRPAPAATAASDQQANGPGH